MEERWYAAIDLKSFYASVECVERGLDPLDTLLVVADRSRTEKTICLAVSPALKAHGIPGRARLFEVEEGMRRINTLRRMDAPRRRLLGSSTFAHELEADPALQADYITAPPQMKKYMAYSARIYGVYLRYVAPEDIQVYSIDEVFIDLTPYLQTYGLTPRALTEKLMEEVLQETGITATAGVGTNLYLAKVAMDIVAKHAAPNEHGARIAELTEQTYREQLWGHRPITDFWRVGLGTARRLASRGVYTMGDLARMSLSSEDALYKIFGVNAELLIDHAWGWEPCTLEAVKAYTPESKSVGSGQVLMRPYAFSEARIIVREMAESLSLDLVDRGLLAGEVYLYIGYDVENLTGGSAYGGEVIVDYYGRSAPKPGRPRSRLRSGGGSKPYGAPRSGGGRAAGGGRHGPCGRQKRTAGSVQRSGSGGTGPAGAPEPAAAGTAGPAGGAGYPQEVRRQRHPEGHGSEGRRHHQGPERPDRRS